MDEADERGVRRKRRRAAGRRPETRRAPAVPTDPVLKRALHDPEMRAAVRRLQPAERMLLTLAASGLSPAAIADLLGKSSKSVSQQLYLARRQLRVWLGEGKAGAAVLLALLPHRVRILADRGQRLMASVAAAPSAVVTALVPLLVYASSVPAVAAPSSVAAPTLVAAPATLQPEVHEISTRGVDTTPNPGPARSSAAAASQGNAGGANSVAKLLLLAADSPDTTYVTSVAPSPRYQQDHTVFALGLGERCGCSVLSRSTDGGASWTTSITGVSGTQVAVSSDYPTDPRIFIGQDAADLGTDWVSAGWGEPFMALPFPAGAAGRLAVVDGHIYSAGLAAVWTFAGSVPTPVVTYEGGVPASLATAGGSAYILAAAHAAGPGSVLASTPTLFVCASKCRFVSAVDLPGPGPLAAAGAVVAAAAGARVMLSTDGGQTFHDASTRGAPSVQTLAATGSTLWRVGATAVEARAIGEFGVWVSLTLTQRVRSIVPLSGTRLVAQLANGGLQCSDNGGMSWTQRCTPA